MNDDSRARAAFVLMIATLAAGCGATSSSPAGGEEGQQDGGQPPPRPPTSPPGLLIPTMWTELDAPAQRPLATDTDDCYAAGFNLKAVLALLPAMHDDILRTVRVAGSVAEKDEPIHVTVAYGSDIAKASCAAPLKPSGCCDVIPDGPRCACAAATMPTIAFEATVEWSPSGATPITFVGRLIATPAQIVVSSGPLAPPAGWTGSAIYQVLVDPAGFSGRASDAGCSPCMNHVQRLAAFPVGRASVQ